MCVDVSRYKAAAFEAELSQVCKAVCFLFSAGRALEGGKARSLRRAGANATLTHCLLDVNVSGDTIYKNPFVKREIFCTEAGRG